jgi:hypothetical protein
MMKLSLIVLVILAIVLLMCSSCGELLDSLVDEKDWVRVDSLGTDLYSVNFLTDNYGYAVKHSITMAVIG